MVINKLSNQLDNRLREAGRVQNDGETKKTEETRDRNREVSSMDDRVSVQHPGKDESDEALARTELDKLNRERFEKLKELKGKLQEFQDAKREVVERILDTELGQQVEDPQVLQRIARQMIDPASRL
ncbi:MAG: hypothetical protein WD115_04795 [Balneolaceae bacterium]